jgi:hypothetical protein
MPSAATSGKIPKPPEYMMRYMLHNIAKPYAYFSLAASVGAGLVYLYFYVLPQRNQYRNFVRLVVYPS